jgi:hypothetical protein
MNIWELLADKIKAALAGVADAMHDNIWQAVKIANKVRPPVTTADYTNVGFQKDYTPPRPNRTIGIVFRMIFRSSHSEQCWI